MSLVPRSITSLEEEIAILEEQEKQARELPDETPKNPRLEKAKDDSQKEDIPDSGEEEEKTDSSETVDKENWKKRFSDLRRHTQKKDDKIKELERKLQEKAASPLPSVEEAKQWAKENPKAAEIIRALAEDQVQERVKPHLDEVDKIRSELQKDKDRIKIMKVHNDFEEIIEEDAFHDWAESQPSRVKELVYEGEADDVIWAISMYKRSQEKPLNSEKEAAKLVKTKPSSKPTDNDDNMIYESDVNDMSPSDYEKNEAKISEAMRSGRFVYDLTGGGRG